jgi:hypothetical protein
MAGKNSGSLALRFWNVLSASLTCVGELRCSSEYCGGDTYLLVLRAVFVCHLLPFNTEMLDKAGIHYQFLTNRMAGEFPGELVLPACCLVIILGVDDIIVALLEFSMVVLDSVANSRHLYTECR